MILSSVIKEKQHRIGLSTDPKPSNLAPGSTIYEYDLKRTLVTPDGDHWALKPDPASDTDILAATTTIDLSQAAGTYDLFTASSRDILVMELTVIIPRDLTSETSFTGFTVQSTDADPVEFIDSATGAKANLTQNAHIQFFGNGRVGGGQKIQLTINGGAVAEECECTAYIQYVGVV